MIWWISTLDAFLDAAPKGISVSSWDQIENLVLVLS